MKNTKKMKKTPPSKNARHSIFGRIAEWLYGLSYKNSNSAKGEGKLPHPVKDKEGEVEGYDVNMLEVEQMVIMRELVTDILRSYISTFIIDEISTKHIDGGGLELTRWVADELKGISQSHGYGALPMKSKIFLGGIISKKTHQYKKLLAKFGENV